MAFFSMKSFIVLREIRKFSLSFFCIFGALSLKKNFFHHHQAGKKENNAKPSDLMLFGEIRRAIKCPEILRSHPVEVSRWLPYFYEILLRFFSLFLFSIWQLFFSFFFALQKIFLFLSKIFHITLLHNTRSVSHVTCSMLHIRALKAA